MSNEQWVVLIGVVWALFLTATLMRIAGALDRIASRSGPSLSGVEQALRGIERLMPRREIKSKPLPYVASGLPQIYSEPIVFPESWRPPGATLNEKGEWTT